MKHPMQPLVVDPSGTARFQENKLVRYLLDHGGMDMNHLAGLEFSEADRTQFAQLIGYSLSGFHELPYVSDADALAASRAARRLDPAFGGCRDTGCPIHCDGSSEE
jgi:hypothetical protein